MGLLKNDFCVWYDWSCLCGSFFVFRFARGLMLVVLTLELWRRKKCPNFDSSLVVRSAIVAVRCVGSTKLGMFVIVDLTVLLCLFVAMRFDCVQAWCSWIFCSFVCAYCCLLQKLVMFFYLLRLCLEVFFWSSCVDVLFAGLLFDP